MEAVILVLLYGDFWQAAFATQPPSYMQSRHAADIDAGYCLLL